MDDIVRLPRCAYAIGSTPKAVSHYLARFPDLAGAHAPNSWNAFRPASIVKLACLTVLIRYGFLVDEAFDVVAKLDPILTEHMTDGPYGAWPALMMTLADERLTASRNKCGPHGSLSPLPGDDRGDGQHTGERLVLDLLEIAAGCAAKLAGNTEADFLPPPAPPANAYHPASIRKA